jgi:hypothetical protein
VRWLLPLVLLACGGARPMTSIPPCQLIEAEADVAACVGRTVTLRGRIARTKIPTLLGVDVDAADELADRPAEATGMLQRYIVEPPPAGAPIAASRGPGTYLRLVGAGGGLATARAVP